MYTSHSRIGAAGSIFLLFAMVTAAATDEISVATPDEFYVSLATPPEFGPLADTEMPHCFGGVLLTAWTRDTTYGRAIIYVVAKRHQGPTLIAHIAGSLEQYLQQANIVHEIQLDNVSVMGRPAARFTMTGEGTGRIISALSEKHLGDKATYMEIILTTNPWNEGAGTDFFLFVLGCPQSAKPQMEASFQSLLDASKLTGHYTPSGLGWPPSDRPSMAVDGINVLSGLLHTKSPNASRTISIQLLRPQGHGINISWETGAGESAQVYICVWIDMRAAWVIPGPDFRRLAHNTGELYQLSYTEEMADYLGRWDYLWSTRDD